MRRSFFFLAALPGRHRRVVKQRRPENAAPSVPMRRRQSAHEIDRRGKEGKKKRKGRKEEKKKSRLHRISLFFFSRFVPPFFFPPTIPSSFLPRVFAFLDSSPTPQGDAQVTKYALSMSLDRSKERGLPLCLSRKKKIDFSDKYIRGFLFPAPSSFFFLPHYCVCVRRCTGSRFCALSVEIEDTVCRRHRSMVVERAAVIAVARQRRKSHCRTTRLDSAVIASDSRKRRTASKAAPWNRARASAPRRRHSPLSTSARHVRARSCAVSTPTYRSP